jgi:hypothetical protein
MSIKSHRVGADVKANYHGSRRALNDEAVSLDAGTLVYVSGGDGASGLPMVSRSDKDKGEFPPTHVCRTFFAAKPSAVGESAQGVISDWFLVENQDTSASYVGAPVYLGDDGQWIFNAVSGPKVGEVRTVHATKGVVELNPSLYAHGGGEFERTVRIPAAAVRTLNATPVEVVPAPGVGKVIEVISVLAKLDFAAPAYDSVGGSENLLIRYNNPAGTDAVDPIPGVGFGDAVADAFYHAPGAAANISTHINDPLVASIASGEWYVAAGDSDLVITVRYHVLTA